jgi:hypothetical protein
MGAWAKTDGTATKTRKRNRERREWAPKKMYFALGEIKVVAQPFLSRA